MELMKDGKRLDGRKRDELRPITIEAGPLYRANGSCYLEWGGNKVMAAVYGPKECHPRHIQDPRKSLIQAKYNMASFSVSDRKRPGPDRRSREISKITSEAMANVVLTELYPRASIEVEIEILDADAGTRCAGITAGAVAMADAGIPMRDIPVACAAGKVADTVVLDLMGDEDKEGQADVPIAIAPRTDDILLLQMDGHLTTDEFEEALELAMDGCNQIAEMQKKALLNKYKTFEEE